MRLEYFQMLDRVARLDVEAGEIETAATVPEKSTVFEGHFPGHALMPGVLLIETMAQTCGTMIMAINAYERLPLLVGVKNAKLRRFVEPLGEMTIEGRLEHDGSGYAVAKGRISMLDDGKTVWVADAELTYTLIHWPNEALKAFMIDHVASLRDTVAAP